MTDESKERRINPRSLENLKLGAEARYQGKVRRNTTLLPETIEWLEGRGNVSEMIDQLVAAAKSASNNKHDSTLQQTEPEPSSNHKHDSIIEGGFIRWNVYKSVQSYDRKQNLDVWDEWELVGSYKSEVEADRTIQNLKEYNHRMNSGDHVPLRLRFEKRLEVIAPAKRGSTPTPTVSELQESVNRLSQQLMEAVSENAALKAEMSEWARSCAQAQYRLDSVIAERDNAQSQLEDMAGKAGEWYDKASLCEQRLQEQESQQLPDLEAVRDRILQGLKLGRQAPEYKRTKAILERFIQELQQ